MVAGSYDVETSSRKSYKYSQVGDTSYKSCVCALLVFVALCVIIILVACLGNWKGEKDENRDEVEFEQLHEDPTRKSSVDIEGSEYEILYDEYTRSTQILDGSTTTSTLLLHPSTITTTRSVLQSTTETEISSSSSVEEFGSSTTTAILVLHSSSETEIASSISSTSTEELYSSTTTTPVLLLPVETATSSSISSTSIEEAGRSTTTTPVLLLSMETATSSTSIDEVGRSTTTTPVLLLSVETATSSSTSSTSIDEVGRSTTTTPVLLLSVETATTSSISSTSSTPVLHFSTGTETSFLISSTSTEKLGSSTTTNPVLPLASETETSLISYTSTKEHESSTRTTPLVFPFSSGTDTSSLISSTSSEKLDSITITTPVLFDPSETKTSSFISSASTKELDSSTKTPILLSSSEISTSSSVSSTSIAKLDSSTTTTPVLLLSPGTETSSLISPTSTKELDSSTKTSTLLSSPETSTSSSISSISIEELDTSTTTTPILLLSSGTETSSLISSTSIGELASSTTTPVLSLSSETETLTSSTSTKELDSSTTSTPILPLSSATETSSLISFTSTKELDSSTTTPILLSSAGTASSSSISSTSTEELDSSTSTTPVLSLSTETETSSLISSKSAEMPDSSTTTITPVLHISTETVTSFPITRTTGTEISDGSTSAVLSPSTRTSLFLSTSSKLDASTITITPVVPKFITTSAETFDDDSTTVSSVDDESSTPLFEPEPVPIDVRATDKIVSAKGCTTEVCKRKASQMLSQISYSAKVCEDFYEFACGESETSRKDMRNIRARKRILKSVRNSATSPSTVSFNKFYHNCLRYDPRSTNNVQVLATITRLIGDFITEDKPEDHLTEILARTLLLNSALLFDIDLEANEDDVFELVILPPRNSMLKAYESGFDVQQINCKISTDQKLYTSSANLNTIHKEYESCSKDEKSFMHDVDYTLKQLNISAAFTEDVATKVDAHIKTELLPTIQTKLLPIWQKAPRTVEREFKISNRASAKMPIGQVQDTLGVIDWKKLFELLTDATISDSTNVRIYFPDYLKKLFTELKAIEKRTLYNILFVLFTENILHDVILPAHSYPREEYCLKLTTKLLPDVLRDIYMKSWTEDYLRTVRTRTEQVYNDLSKEVHSLLLNSDYFRTRKTRTTKPISIELALSFDMIDDDDVLIDYPKLTDNHFENLLTVSQRWQKKKYSDWSAKPSEKIWSHYLTPFDVEPKFIYQLKKLAIPYGMFDDTFTDQAEFVLLPELGVTLAQFLMKYVITDYRKFKLSSEYDFIHDCSQKFMMREKSFTIDEIKIKFNQDDKFTANKFMEDVAAMKLAYNLYKTKTKDLTENLPWLSDEYSPDKLFYISAAQEFCDVKENNPFTFMEHLFEANALPGRIRLYNSLKHNSEFSKIFSCPAGSNLGQPEVCNLLPFEGHVSSFATT